MPNEPTRSISIIVTAMNEAGNLEATVRNVIAAASPRFDDFEIIIVDDGSTDGTTELADLMAAADARIVVHHNGQNRGLAYSYRTGVALARKRYTSWVAGNNIVPRDGLERLYDRVGEVDVVLSYVLTDVRGLFRQAISRTFTVLLNLLFGMRLRYYTGPCVYPTDALQQLRTITGGSMVVPEIVLRMLMPGRSYVEVPLQPQPRTSGKTKTFRLRNIMYVGMSLARLFWDLRVKGALVAAKRARVDAVIAVGIFVLGFLAGAAYRRTFQRSDAAPDFVLYEFGAAAAFACGHGFVDPGYAPSPAFEDFLHQRRDRITCADLPASTTYQPPNLTQGLYRYLMIAVGLFWMVSGSMSWTGLTPLYAGAYGATLVLAYALFRLSIGRVMSTLAALALLVSPVHIGYVPFLRDYAKAPFMLALMLIIARFAVGRPTSARAVAWSALFGIVLAIGFGFRNDLLIAIVPWTVIVLLYAGGRTVGEWRLKAICLATSAATFVAAAWPLLRAYSHGSNSGHVAFLGLMTTFDGPLGISPSIYQWGYVYLDGYASAIVNSFAYREYGHPVAYLSKGYDAAMGTYVLAIARHWPADMLVRAWAAVVKVVDLPFSVAAHVAPVPYGIHDARVVAFYKDMMALSALAGTGIVFVGAALAIVSATSVRTAAVLLLLLLYFAGYPALQFQIRHFFHLEFIAWAAIAFVLERAAIGSRALVRGGRRGFEWRAVAPAMRATAVRVGAFAGVALLITAGPVWALRLYQSAHVRHLFERAYLGAAREPVATTATIQADHKVLLDMPALWASRNPNETVSTAYLVVEISPVHCDYLIVRPRFRYDAKFDASNFSHTVDVPMVNGSDRPTTVLSAVFLTATTRFRGIELDEGAVPCVAAISRVKDSQIPDVLVEARFMPQWRQTLLYQTVRRWERPANSEIGPTLFTDPPGLGVRANIRPFEPIALASADTSSIVSRQEDGEFAVNGRPDSSYSQIIRLKEQALTAGTVVVARGEVRTGGITLGLLRAGRWVAYTNVEGRGPFLAAVEVPETGSYSVDVANYVPGGWAQAHLSSGIGTRLLRHFPFARANDVVISVLGWTPPGAAEEPAR